MMTAGVILKCNHFLFHLISGAACDESSAYRDCLSDVDLYIKDPASWPTLCRYA